jgi:hypothetical protein
VVTCNKEPAKNIFGECNVPTKVVRTKKEPAKTIFGVSNAKCSLPTLVYLEYR